MAFLPRSKPGARLQIGGKPRFGAARRRLVGVFKAYLRRQAHHNGFSAPAVLQAKMGAAVVEQVKFDVTPAAVALKFAFALAPSDVFPRLDDGQIGGEVGLTHALRKRASVGKGQFVEIIKENAADAARFAAMRQVEIAVAPVFAFGIETV